MVPESAISVQHDANDSGASITKSPLAGTRRLGSFMRVTAFRPRSADRTPAKTSSASFCGRNTRAREG